MMPAGEPTTPADEPPRPLPAPRRAPGGRHQPRTANALAGARRASGMAFFIVGGNFGFALGPLAMGALVATYGRSGSLGMLVLALAAPPALWLAMRQVTRSAAAARQGSRPVAV